MNIQEISKTRELVCDCVPTIARFIALPSGCTCVSVVCRLSCCFSSTPATLTAVVCEQSSEEWLELWSSKTLLCRTELTCCCLGWQKSRVPLTTNGAAPEITGSCYFRLVTPHARVQAKQTAVRTRMLLRCKQAFLERT